jgi:hypothetical protein
MTVQGLTIGEMAVAKGADLLALPDHHVPRTRGFFRQPQEGLL